MSLILFVVLLVASLIGLHPMRAIGLQKGLHRVKAILLNRMLAAAVVSSVLLTGISTPAKGSLVKRDNAKEKENE
jgi:hypothetical protein